MKGSNPDRCGDFRICEVGERLRRDMSPLGTDGLRTLLLVLYPLLAILIVPLTLAGTSVGLRFQLFRDPAHELGVLFGIFAFFGNLMWAAATTCCALAWTFLARTSPSHPLRPWFLASAVLSGALMIDDTFVIHEVVLPEYVGIPEPLVYLGYAIGVGLYLIRFGRVILNRADSAVFVVSMVLLGTSAVIDLIDRRFPFQDSTEEMAKLLGITAWLYFFFRATLAVIRTDPSPEGTQ
jgi:hypothetical protein